MSAVFAFIIDTNQCSAYFKDELCAYLTGKPGETLSANPNLIASLFWGKYYTEAREFKQIIYSYDYCRSFETPFRYKFNWVDETFDANYDLSAIYTQAVVNIENCYNACIGIHQPEADAGNSKSKSIVNQYKKTMADEIKTPPVRNPVYESVAIYFKQRPTDKQIAFMKERAYEFAKDPEFQHLGINIAGFRIMEQVTTESIAPV